MKDKLSNIQKESEKIKIKKSISEYEDLKAKALLKLGIKTFEKIRKYEIIDEDFNLLCEEIKSFDIEIYTRYMQLKTFENKNNKTICECGYVAFKNERFCPQCGKNLEKEENANIICSNCNQETEESSNFCACCGSKINKESTNYEEEIYCIDDENIEYYTQEEDIPEVDMIEEKEESYLGEVALEKEYIIEENYIEEEGRSFLKEYKHNIEN